ncbi:hypothetical protein [Paenibacillus taiwanensis]|uniref:hypothetical protein n=1 Tax=Paenibacillus taiwanensis TaxID=401638 RepID=UPI0003FBEA75|nr:hypothetical protein [Paenibacillus taiwanensis]
MQQAVIRFQFSDAHSTALAYDTLDELGYHPVKEAAVNQLHIHVERQDITSALEIVEAHGGQLIEQAEMTEMSVINDAYGMDIIPIPAHVVNEDWIHHDAYVQIDPREDDLSHRDEETRGWSDEESTNHFQGGIHL